MYRTLASALRSYIEDRITTGSAKRRFFRLDGFDEDTYIALLTQFRDAENFLARQPILVRTTAEIEGYSEYALEHGKSATWYRNNVPSGTNLILLFNQQTSDAQSLKDIYPITETVLVREGLDFLLDAAFRNYQLVLREREIITEFVSRLHKDLVRPQLRDLTEFLIALDEHMSRNPADTIETAIALSLTYLNLFKCRELAEVVNTTRGSRLLHQNYQASQIGLELLDDTRLRAYLSLLDQTDFDDESQYGGLSPREKRNFLAQFIENVISDRETRLRILQIDWGEVAPIFYKRKRQSQSERLKELADELRQNLSLQQAETDVLSNEAQDAIYDLANGRLPEEQSLDSLLTEIKDDIPNTLINAVKRLRGAKKHQNTDFVSGLTYLAVELLSPIETSEDRPFSLVVQFEPHQLDTISPKEREALLAFRTLYGGIENAVKSVNWELDGIWELAKQYDDAEIDTVEGEEEREKAGKVTLEFQVDLFNNNNERLSTAELIWEYRLDGPSSATCAHIWTEARKLRSENDFRLCVPIYNNCQSATEIGDLDLSRPVESLGAWYRHSVNLRETLHKELEQRTTPEVWSTLENHLFHLEDAWSSFVSIAARNGIWNTNLYGLLENYEALLECAALNLQYGQEAAYGFRILTQAWVIGPNSFDEWVVLSSLHPLKLQWLAERTNHFDALIYRLLKTNTPIVDEKRLRQELLLTYGSGGYPAIIALPGYDLRANYFLPITEVEGYELYRPLGQAGIAYGLDPELVTDDESKQAAQIASRDLARIVRDYLETYPFVRDGLEIYLLQCRNGALPGLLVEELEKLLQRRSQKTRLNVIVHTTDRGAPLYQRVVEWLKANETYLERPSEQYFPLVTLKVMECSFEDLFRRLDDTDLVILPDVLAEKGQKIETTQTERAMAIPLQGFLPIHRNQQAPFERRELVRDVLLTTSPQPTLLQHFYNIQWAAKEERPILSDITTEFQLQVSLRDWESVLKELHHRFNWVVCYDTTVDRFLLEATFHNTVEVIRYSLGLGSKRQHNLTVSSSHRAQDIVVSRLTSSLESILSGTPHDFRLQVAQRLVDEAKEISGDIVLRAAGPGAYLNELIGMIIAKHNVQKRYLSQHPGALTAWIYLDDFAHWFDRKYPDLLFIALPTAIADEFNLHVEVIETKCISEANFAHEAADAQRQVAQGVNRLAQAWAPNMHHLDAPYWYDQLYRAVVGNLVVSRDQKPIWEEFRHRTEQGDFSLQISGHSWVCCYDGSAGLDQPVVNGDAIITAPEAPEVPHIFHHFGRAGLRRSLRELVEEKWQIDSPPSAWASDFDFSTESYRPPEPETFVEEQHVETSRKDSLDEPHLRLVEETSDSQDNILDEWLAEKARNLNRALRNYHVSAFPIEPDKADIGPSIVRFKIRLRPGEKLSKVQNIAADLQRELALEATPIADNILGTNYVGIDLPHPNPQVVSLLPKLNELERPTIGQIPFLVGMTPDGRSVSTDLAEIRHMLVAGSTGSGKTIFLYSLLVSLLSQFHPKNLGLVLIDPKQTDFVYFEDIPHLLNDEVIIEPENAIQWLQFLTDDILPARTNQLREGRSRDIKDYNSRNPDTPLAPLVVIIDEYADLVQVLDKTGRKEFEHSMIRLAQRARNVGIHLVIATQRPSADIVTSSLKTNLPARVAFRLPSHHDSMTILDQTGAENLLGKGDMLFKQEGQIERLQGFFLSTDDLLEFLEKHT